MLQRFSISHFILLREYILSNLIRPKKYILKFFLVKFISSSYFPTFEDLWDLGCVSWVLTTYSSHALVFILITNTRNSKKLFFYFYINKHRDKIVESQNLIDWFGCSIVYNILEYFKG